MPGASIQLLTLALSTGHSNSSIPRTTMRSIHAILIHHDSSFGAAYTFDPLHTFRSCDVALLTRDKSVLLSKHDKNVALLLEPIILFFFFLVSRFVALILLVAHWRLLLLLAVFVFRQSSSLEPILCVLLPRVGPCSDVVHARGKAALFFIFWRDPVLDPWPTEAGTCVVASLLHHGVSFA